MDLNKYWKNVREKQTELTESDYYLMPLVNDEKNAVGGGIVQCSRERAARNLVDGTHRLADAPEIEAYLAGEKARAQKDAEAELARKQPIHITLGPGTVVSNPEPKPAEPVKPTETPKLEPKPETKPDPKPGK